jgi:hypothetical protein
MADAASPNCSAGHRPFEHSNLQTLHPWIIAGLLRIMRTVNYYLSLAHISSIPSWSQLPTHDSRADESRCGATGCRQEGLMG